MPIAPTTPTPAGGRDAFRDWIEAQPDNYYDADGGLQRGLLLHLGEAAFAQIEPGLRAFGAAAAAVDQAVRENNMPANLPRLEARDGIGREVDRVVHHPSYDVVGRAIYEGGCIAALGDNEHANIRALSLFYLSSQNGEAGHNCPVACTAGLVKLLQHVGSTELKERYLPGLLSTDYDTHLHAAQFLTEVQGGSDVGANATTATPSPEQNGEWLLSGEKWFCSNINADLALLTARLPGGREGTAGLGLFLMPLRSHGHHGCARGEPAGYRIWRLKDKVGTRSMATGEIELTGARAYPVGPPQDGFRNMMRYVIHTSRIYNALSSAGGMRRATIVAWTYAQHRTAFGSKIGTFPLVQETLAAMRSDTAAVRAACLDLMAHQDALDIGVDAATGDAAAQRMAINLNKTYAARLGHEVCNQGIEVLGGNGTIETFSVLPRLLRDNVVSENWEGTHNTLFVQWLRDAATRRMDRPFFASLLARYQAIDPAGSPAIEQIRKLGLERTAQAQCETEEILQAPRELATLQVRRLGDRACALLYAACLAREAGFARAIGRQNADDTCALAEHFWYRRIEDCPDRNAAYAARIARISRCC